MLPHISAVIDGRALTAGARRGKQHITKHKLHGHVHSAVLQLEREARKREADVELHARHVEIHQPAQSRNGACL